MADRQDGSAFAGPMADRQDGNGWKSESRKQKCGKLKSGHEDTNLVDGVRVEPGGSTPTAGD